MKKIISTLALILIVGSTAFCQTDKEYTATLKKFFEISGCNSTSTIAIEQMVEIFKPQYPNIDAKEWERIGKDFMQKSMDKFIEMSIPIYQKYLSKSDLEEMIKFYQSPIGQKIVQSNAIIAKESIPIAQKWGMELSKKLIEEIEKASK